MEGKNFAWWSVCQWSKFNRTVILHRARRNWRVRWQSDWERPTHSLQFKTWRKFNSIISTMRRKLSGWNHSILQIKKSQNLNILTTKSCFHVGWDQFHTQNLLEATSKKQNLSPKISLLLSPFSVRVWKVSLLPGQVWRVGEGGRCEVCLSSNFTHGAQISARNQIWAKTTPLLAFSGVWLILCFSYNLEPATYTFHWKHETSWYQSDIYDTITFWGTEFPALRPRLLGNPLDPNF